MNSKMPMAIFVHQELSVPSIKVYVSLNQSLNRHAKKRP